MMPIRLACIALSCVAALAPAQLPRLRAMNEKMETPVYRDESIPQLSPDDALTSFTALMEGVKRTRTGPERAYEIPRFEFRVKSMLEEPVVYTQTAPGEVTIPGAGAVRLLAIGVQEPIEQRDPNEPQEPMTTLMFQPDLTPMTDEQIRKLGGPFQSYSGDSSRMLYYQVRALIQPHDLEGFRIVRTRMEDEESGRSLDYSTSRQSKGNNIEDLTLTITPTRTAPMLLKVEFTWGPRESQTLALQHGAILATRAGVIGVLDNWAPLSGMSYSRGQTDSIRLREWENSPFKTNGAMFLMMPAEMQSIVQMLPGDPESDRKIGGDSSMSGSDASYATFSISGDGPMESVRVEVPSQRGLAVFRIPPLPPLPKENVGVTNPWDLTMPRVVIDDHFRLVNLTTQISGYNVMEEVTPTALTEPIVHTKPVTLGELWLEAWKRYPPDTEMVVEEERRWIRIRKKEPNAFMKWVREALE